MQTTQANSIAIYARFSCDRQTERSIEDQVRRCREHIALSAIGDPLTAQVFADYAISGSTLIRAGFEGLMQAVDAGTVKMIITEDMSRVSRDFADSAAIFKRLRYAEVPLIGVADGIDTSAKHAKLSFTLKSLVADLYIDDLRDKTLRGLRGRALAGLSTGCVPIGYKSTALTDARNRITGYEISVDANTATIVRRIFRDYGAGKAFATIARELNREGIPSPRVGTRHVFAGWSMGTIRTILLNARYVGTWRFGERQWVRVPGTNVRRPRRRDATDVIETDRPDLRIIDDGLWTTVQARFTRSPRRGRTTYLLSGMLRCAECSSPMTIYGSSNVYYRCARNKTGGTCTSSTSVRESVARQLVIDGLRAGLRDGYASKRLPRKLKAKLDETNVETAIAAIDSKLMTRVDVGKETLRAWVKEGSIRCKFVDGAPRMDFAVMPMKLINDVTANQPNVEPTRSL